MAYLQLVGTGGWSERWEIRAAQEKEVAAELAKVGSAETTGLRVVDPQTANDVTLFVAWASVATAVIIPDSTDHTDVHGQYA